MGRSDLRQRISGSGITDRESNPDQYEARRRKPLSTGIALAAKTQVVSIRVKVLDGEPVAAALARLDKLVRRVNGRPAHKRRFGYFEKPSELRRKRAKKEAVRPGYPLHVHPHSALHARTGPSNTLMR